MPSGLKFGIWLKYTQGPHVSSLSQFQWWLGVEPVGSVPQSSPVARLILSSTRRMPQDGTTISPNQKQHQEQRLYSQATTSSIMMMMIFLIPWEQKPLCPIPGKSSAVSLLFLPSGSQSLSPRPSRWEGAENSLGSPGLVAEAQPTAGAALCAMCLAPPPPNPWPSTLFLSQKSTPSAARPPIHVCQEFSSPRWWGSGSSVFWAQSPSSGSIRGKTWMLQMKNKEGRRQVLQEGHKNPPPEGKKSRFKNQEDFPKVLV